MTPGDRLLAIEKYPPQSSEFLCRPEFQLPMGIAPRDKVP